MTHNDIPALIGRRIQQADDALKQAKILLDINQAFGAANRAYYAMFYATLALLLSKNLGSSKHAGVIALFDKEFIKTGHADVQWSKKLHHAFRLRNQGDYDDWMSVSEDEAKDLYDDAKQFIELQ